MIVAVCDFLLGLCLLGFFGSVEGVTATWWVKWGWDCSSFDVLNRVGGFCGVCGGFFFLFFHREKKGKVETERKD